MNVRYSIDSLIWWMDRPSTSKHDLDFINPRIEDVVTVMSLRGDLLAKLPDHLITDAVVDTALRQEPLALQWVPEEMKTSIRVDASVYRNPHALPYVPKSLITHKMIQYCLENDPQSKAGSDEQEAKLIAAIEQDPGVFARLAPESQTTAIALAYARHPQSRLDVLTTHARADLLTPQVLAHACIHRESLDGLTFKQSLDAMRYSIKHGLEGNRLPDATAKELLTYAGKTLGTTRRIHFEALARLEDRGAQTLSKIIKDDKDALVFKALYGAQKTERLIGRVPTNRDWLLNSMGR